MARGTTHWLGFVVTSGGEWWPAGYTIATGPLLVVTTAALAGTSLAGLALRGLPERRFLLVTLAVGVFLLAIAHTGPVSSPFAPTAQALLDGPLVAFRNIHKADPLVRLPLAVGLAVAVERLAKVLADRSLTVRLAAAAAGGLVLLVVVSPGLSGAIAPRGTFPDMARQWRQAGAWLSDHADGRAGARGPRVELRRVRLGSHHRRADPPVVHRRLRRAGCRAAHPGRHHPPARRRRGAPADRARRRRGRRRAAPPGCAPPRPAQRPRHGICGAAVGHVRALGDPLHPHGRARPRLRHDPHRRERGAGLPGRDLRHRPGRAGGRHPARHRRRFGVRRAGGPARRGRCRGGGEHRARRARRRPRRGGGTRPPRGH